MSFAALPMYDFPELRGATDAWWTGLAGHLRAEGISDVAATLDRSRRIEEQWSDPALLFGQSCGYPVTHAYADVLRIVATPRHAVRGCEGGLYHSVIVVREDAPIVELGDLRGRTAVINDPTSQSGTNAFGALLAPLLGASSERGARFFRDVLLSGSHAGSLAMVQDGRAEVASIDCVTFALLARWRKPALEGIRVLDKTASVPALPYVTSRTTSAETLARIRTALANAATDPALAPVRADLLLEGVTVLPDTEYDVIRAMHATHRLGMEVVSAHRSSGAS